MVFLFLLSENLCNLCMFSGVLYSSRLVPLLVILHSCFEDSCTCWLCILLVVVVVVVIENIYCETTQRQGVGREQKLVESKASESSSSLSASARHSNAGMGGVNPQTVAEGSPYPVGSLQFGSMGLENRVPLREQKSIWIPKSYGTVSGPTEVGPRPAPVEQVILPGKLTQKESAGIPADVLSKLLSGKLLESFTTDSSTYSIAQVRATFYPKFENEKSDQEVSYPIHASSQVQTRYAICLQL